MRFLLFGIIMVLISCNQKESYHFEIGNSEGLTTPEAVRIHMPGLNPREMSLYNGERNVNFQYDELTQDLWFIHHPENHLQYTLKQLSLTAKNTAILKAKKHQGNMELAINNQAVVQYRYEMSYPPEGIDSIYGKSGYIHPLITPRGDTLTRIQPPDHWHHYGLWGPWTHTQVNGQRVDFWNLGEGMGTVLFKEFKNVNAGAVFASLTASQEHIDYKTTESPNVALNEELQIKLWNSDNPDRYVLDYISNFSSPLKEGILFEAYRYGGGIGLRFNERWKADNCTVLTSEGKDRLSADGSNARWCIVSGAASYGGTNGILFMSHPNNRMHPEPMRIWPVDANGGRGDMFFEFCPIRHQEWKIEPDKNYQLQYRMVVFEGELNADEAEAYWQAFAQPPTISLIEN
ncbi:PmoA family protein [Muriicola sp. Z0-33]|nr:PmoA family protein [Muriicola sp. Z0-33]